MAVVDEVATYAGDCVRNCYGLVKSVTIAKEVAPYTGECIRDC
jgi:hypothetical protein